MDKLDICLIPLIYLLRMTLTLLSFTIVFVPNPLKLWSALKNRLTWIYLIIIHLILFVLKQLHSLVTIKLVQCLLNMLLLTTISHICLYWTRFYYNLLYKKNGRSICNIIANRMPPPVSSKATRPYNCIVYLNEKLYCHSFYQVRGAHARLNQEIEKDLDKVVAKASQLLY